MLLILASFVCSKLWTLLPESGAEHDFFPYHSQTLTLRMHVYFICERVSVLVLIWAAMICTADKLFHMVFALYALRIVDYLLRYEEAWFKIGAYPIEYGTLMMVALAIIFGKMIYGKYT